MSENLNEQSRPLNRICILCSARIVEDSQNLIALGMIEVSQENIRFIGELFCLQCSNLIRNILNEI